MRRPEPLLSSNPFISRHNELDIPNITSPLMYEKITARKSVPQLYEEKLIVGCYSFLSYHPFLAFSVGPWSH